MVPSSVPNLFWFSGIIILSSVTTFLPASAQNQGKGAVLQGAVSHSDVLPPLELEAISRQISLTRAADLGRPANPAKTPALQNRSDNQLLPSTKKANTSATAEKPSAISAGNVSNNNSGRKSASLSVSTLSARRYQLPNWLVGVWQRTLATEFSRVKLPSGSRVRPLGTSVARVTDTFGTYSDKSGHVYQIFDPSHSSGEVDRGRTIDFEHIFDYKLKILDSQRVLVEARAWHAQFNKSSRQVVDAYQDEEYNVYTILAPG